MRNMREYLEKMMALGVSETEAKIYHALLVRRDLSARQIQEIAKVPRTKVYEVAQKMVLRGMCIEKKMGSKKRYQAVEPRRALTRLLNQYKKQLEEKRALAQDIERIITPIYKEATSHLEITDYVEVIKDLPSIHERYINLVKNTKKEFVGFVKPPYAHRQKVDKLDEQEDVEFEIIKRGVVVRVLYEYPEENEVDEIIEHIKRCISVGEKARVVPRLPIKMYIFDSRYVLMALDNSLPALYPLTMLVIEHPGLAQAALLLFEYLWKQAENYTVLRKLKKKYSKRE